MGSILRKVRARFYQGAEEILDVMAESAGFTKVATMAMTPFARYVGYIDPPRFQKGESRGYDELGQKVIRVDRYGPYNSILDIPESCPGLKTLHLIPYSFDAREIAIKTIFTRIRLVKINKAAMTEVDAFRCQTLFRVLLLPWRSLALSVKLFRKDHADQVSSSVSILAWINSRL
ncbi:hypothetical protein BGZ83_002176 [Gryganskiella cystojenkinii]|nr:hypothetical protein BGZ83_002176 [Gryganskiella cystojenkinii]